VSPAYSGPDPCGPDSGVEASNGMRLLPVPLASPVNARSGGTRTSHGAVGVPDGVTDDVGVTDGDAVCERVCERVPLPVAVPVVVRVRVPLEVTLGVGDRVLEGVTVAVSDTCAPAGATSQPSTSSATRAAVAAAGGGGGGGGGAGGAPPRAGAPPPAAGGPARACARASSLLLLPAARAPGLAPRQARIAHPRGRSGQPRGAPRIRGKRGAHAAVVAPSRRLRGRAAVNVARLLSGRRRGVVAGAVAARPRYGLL
jgi:hypothetical protein